MFSVCFNLVIFVGINFVHGCCNSCMHLNMETMQFSLVIRGHHLHKEVWEPIHGQVVQCVKETSYRFNPFAACFYC